MTRTSVIAMLSGLTLAGGALWLGQRDSQPTGTARREAEAAPQPVAEAERTHDREATRRIEDELASLRAKVRALEAGERAPTDPAAPVAHEPDDEPRDPQQLYASKLRSERIDAAWAPDMEEDIASVFADAALRGSRLEHVECHETVCEFTVAHDGAGARDQFMEGFATLAPKNQELSVETRRGEGQGYRSSGFIVKSGHPLSTVAPGAANASNMLVPSEFAD
jgi:hypothetical protein